MNNKPKILSIDTSSRDGSISVLNGQEVLVELGFSFKDQLSIIIIDTIDSVLKKTNLKINQIDLFVVITGPGLFTGIRVGLTTVKGINFEEDRSIVGVNSLEALVYEFRYLSQESIALIDARRDEVYMAGYKSIKGEPVEFMSPGLIHYTKIPEALNNLREVRLVGSGAMRYRDYLYEQIPWCKIHESKKHLSTLAAQIGLQRYQKGEFIKNPKNLFPLYIRKTDAEMNFS